MFAPLADLPDEHGPRFCINLCAIAGRPHDAGLAAIADVPQATISSPSPCAIYSQQPELMPAESSWPVRCSPSVAIVALSGDGLVVGHRHEVAAGEVAEVVKTRLGLTGEAIIPDPSHTDPWSAINAVAVMIVIIEVDGNGEACHTARQWMRRLKAAICEGKMQPGGMLTGKYLSVLALASSVCAFSSASAGLDKYRGAARIEHSLLEMGCLRLTPAMGTAETETEEVDANVMPWADKVALALDGLAREAARDDARAREVTTPSTEVRDASTSECGCGQPLDGPVPAAAGLDRDRLGRLVSLGLALGIGCGAWLLVRAAVFAQRGRYR